MNASSSTTARWAPAVQAYNLPLDEFWGKDGYNDILVLSRPDVVKEIHAAYFNAGADVIETNTFSSTPWIMAEYDMRTSVHEINMAAAKLAREVASSFSSNGRKRFVAGSMGPTTKLPSLGNIGFDEMASALHRAGDRLDRRRRRCAPARNLPGHPASQGGAGRHLRRAEEDRQEHSGAGAGHAAKRLA